MLRWKFHFQLIDAKELQIQICTNTANSPVLPFGRWGILTIISLLWIVSFKIISIDWLPVNWLAKCIATNRGFIFHRSKLKLCSHQLYMIRVNRPWSEAISNLFFAYWGVHECSSVVQYLKGLLQYNELARLLKRILIKLLALDTWINWFHAHVFRTNAAKWR